MPALNKYLFLVIAYLNFYLCFTQELIPLELHNKCGYINLSGDTVIPFSYDEVSSFSEGVAVVREGGYYGYINKKGEFILPPIYDYAEIFHENRAVVYKDEKKYVIDKSGNKIFALDFFQELFPMTTLCYKNGYAIFQYKKDHVCLFDTNGSKILNIKNGNIKELSGNMYLVDQGKKRGVYNIKQRDWILKLGQIKNTHLDMYRQSLPIDINYQDESRQFFYVQLDSNGKLLNQIRINHADENVKYIGIGAYREIIYSKDDYNRHTLLLYKHKNEEVVRDTAWDDVFQFYNESAFLRTNDFHFRLINKNFSYITDSIYEYVTYPYFNFLAPLKTGVATVSGNMSWGLIDEKGNFVLPYKYKTLALIDFKAGLLIASKEDSSYTIREEKFSQLLSKAFDHTGRMHKDTTLKRDSLLDKELFNISMDYPVETTHYGLIDYKGNIVIDFKYKELALAKYGNNILYFRDENTCGLMYTNGKVICQIELKEPNILIRMNIAWQQRGYFFASGSDQKTQTSGLVLYGLGNQNYPKKMKELPKNIVLKNKSIIISVDTLTKDTFENKYYGHSVYIINNTGDTVFFGVQDSRLQMKVQAKDKSGKWKDIEYLPSSWCGNSYYAIPLNAGDFWKLSTPIYHGVFKTKLRIVLEDSWGYGMNRHVNKKQKNRVYYSNEYNGTINPGQFFRKQEYTQNGLMDPYNE